jgi:transcriptional regulator with XRE-family HTH domain
MEIMKRFPSADTMNRLAEPFKVDPADLFIKTDESEAINTVKFQQERNDLLKNKILMAIDEAF